MTGLILMGGGARAAYQVGVLQAVAGLLPRGAASPFPIICGSSAGAINATALAVYAHDFRRAIIELLRVWRHFKADHVYRADPLSVAGCGLRWMAALLVGGMGRDNPVSLLDNRPLRELLGARLDYSEIERNVVAGHLYALAITASSYSSGHSVSFYQGVPNLTPWVRARRLGATTRIVTDHLVASSAIPFLFPPARIGDEYFGDGSMRQVAPISPALHLGANRVMVIGSSRSPGPPVPTADGKSPTLAQIAGHALNSIFLDSIEADLERLQRVNRTVDAIPPEVLNKNGIDLRRVESLVISPSEPIEPIAARHAHALPRAIRYLLRGLGASDGTGANLVSYLLFDKSYCRSLIRLGHRDALARADEIRAFLAP